MAGNVSVLAEDGVTSLECPLGADVTMNRASLGTFTLAHANCLTATSGYNAGDKAKIVVNVVLFKTGLGATYFHNVSGEVYARLE